MSYSADARNDPEWFGKKLTPSTPVIAVISSEPIEKPKTYKSAAKVQGLISNNAVINATGNIFIYFNKDSSLSLPVPGSLILLNKSAIEINNKDIKGGFDYKRYCVFKGITHQVFLKAGEYALVEKHSSGYVNRFIGSARKYLLALLRKYVKTKKETGLAEALLIAYKQDLDPSLVRSYTNTGVVHIIAISGLHIGLIYWMLAFLFRPLSKTKNLRLLSTILIITGLWLFSIMAGAQPSVLRSALMFTCIAISSILLRRSSVYNSLAVSAIILLFWNPFWLWDLGFQLSYSAVLSIIIFMKPVYNLLFIPNKLLDLAWQLNAVTLSAQILTFPVCIYYFHQFPNYFLVTNMVSVPLSSLILFAEIILCVVGLVPFLAEQTGNLVRWLISLMNNFIEVVAALPYSVTYNLNISFAQLVVFYVTVAYLYSYGKKD